jgi:hypothetical protein
VTLAARGLREEESGRGHARIAGEFLVAVRRQARAVWIQTTAAAIVVTAAAVAFALLRR